MKRSIPLLCAGLALLLVLGGIQKADVVRSAMTGAMMDLGFSLGVVQKANAASHPCAARSCLDAQVVGIADGDTVRLLIERAGSPAQVRLRLTEIDTPERGQPWGARARQALSRKLFRRQVLIASEGEDRYGRLLGRVYLNGRDINREMIREGHAWVYRRYSSDIWLLEDERRARKAGLGLWSLPESQRVPPWEWRRGNRKSP